MFRTDIIIIKEGDNTPWGRAQHVYKLGEGIYSASTASHGGMHLAPEINLRIPPCARAQNGWYEEDCQAAIPPFVLGIEAFTSDSVKRCIASGEVENTVKVWFPYIYEKLTGTILQPGESNQKDEDVFLKEHAQDWLAVSALGAYRDEPAIPEGFVKVWATVGGSRCVHSTKRAFLVPKEEYEQRNKLLYFLVVPEKYQEIGV
jgi:hypothetical protein